MMKNDAFSCLLHVVSNWELYVSGTIEGIAFCRVENGSLTREGVAAAYKSLNEVLTCFICSRTFVQKTQYLLKELNEIQPI